eukprot:TRINITY_DN1037_c0_g1_i1.p1 TRINITY_DN1037_c0_g1~~TRINITY_DN1037_c0_g1_i1.p1  ORF type:complete len:115 (+),score=31.61 TRINITY_DN1037_c0_g1_i1:362-706(+)
MTFFGSSSSSLSCLVLTFLFAATFDVFFGGPSLLAPWLPFDLSLSFGFAVWPSSTSSSPLPDSPLSNFFAGLLGNFPAWTPVNFCSSGTKADVLPPAVMNSILLPVVRWKAQNN